MQDFPNKDICDIIEIEGNNKCNDCQTENPTFTSVNNAVFLCENCANIHKSLGANISLIKSLKTDEFSPEEISLLKIGGNTRFENMVKEYGVKQDHNKEFRYHLKFAEYYRLLLSAEINKEKNPEEYDEILKKKPSLEEGILIMDTVLGNMLKMSNVKKESEISKDVSKISNKIGSFFSFISKKVNEAATKVGITQKFDETRAKFNEGVKNFAENHPKLKNAATKTGEAFGTARKYTADALNKVIESQTMQSLTGKVNNKYNEVINSEIVTNFAKSTEEKYISLKNKVGSKQNEEVSNNNIPQENKQEENAANNEEPKKENPEDDKNQEPKKENQEDKSNEEPKSEIKEYEKKEELKNEIKEEEKKEEPKQEIKEDEKKEEPKEEIKEEEKNKEPKQDNVEDGKNDEPKKEN